MFQLTSKGIVTANNDGNVYNWNRYGIGIDEKDSVWIRIRLNSDGAHP